ncbi:hypothetical protein M3O96_00080 [Aquiflexum sp. TKW24L]|uniref:hypothetical protein n=1 Tax=Aquiflexum sp. TKW24L TaxID=2942212 RepID=UPI0020C07B9A|nr:hypothetical protein [Aquiflexum sp. TKW24L]MCL6257466.1 hypothetical protein [Aquiflexum sp. TKW24L]
MKNLNQNQIINLTQSKTLNARFEAMHAVNFGRSNVKQVLAASEKISTTDLNLTSRAVLLRSLHGDFEEAFELASWAAKADPNSRKAVVDSFVKNKQSTFLVHQIGRQKRADATALMQDYFAQGGNLKDIAEWLCSAGRILKTEKISDGTDFLWGFVEGTARGIAGAVVAAISTVADAVSAAGRNLADAVQEVSKWSQAKVNDFTEALLATGRRIGTILDEAVKNGLSAVDKFINAIIRAGKDALEILKWAVEKSESMLERVLTRLESLLGSFTTLLDKIGRMVDKGINACIKAILKLGKTIGSIVSRLGRFTRRGAIAFAKAIGLAGRTVADIMQILFKETRYIVGVVMEALLSLGNKISDLLKGVIHWTARELSNLIGALKDMGKTIHQVLDEVDKFIGNQAVKVMQAVILIWTNLTEILEAIASKSLSVIDMLLTALIGTALHVKTVLSNVLKDVRDAFRKGLINGLVRIGYAALDLMKEAVKIGASVAAILFTIIMELTGTHRGLNALERAEAEKVFGTSIDLNKVKLTTASFSMEFISWLTGLVKKTPTAFVTMYVINFKPDIKLSTELLIHELTHIWQAVNSGGVYMIEALHSQFFGRGYNLTEAEIRNANGQLLNLEREQQAVLIQEYWKSEFSPRRNGRFPLELIRPLARQVYRSNFIFRPFPTLDLNSNSRILNPLIPTH